MIQSYTPASCRRSLRPSVACWSIKTIAVGVAEIAVTLTLVIKLVVSASLADTLLAIDVPLAAAPRASALLLEDVALVDCDVGAMLLAHRGLLLVTGHGLLASLSLSVPKPGTATNRARLIARYIGTPPRRGVLLCIAPTLPWNLNEHSCFLFLLVLTDSIGRMS